MAEGGSRSPAHFVRESGDVASPMASRAGLAATAPANSGFSRDGIVRESRRHHGLTSFTSPSVFRAGWPGFRAASRAFHAFGQHIIFRARFKTMMKLAFLKCRHLRPHT